MTEFLTPVDPTLAVVAAEPAMLPAARRLAEQLDLPLLVDYCFEEDVPYELLVWVDETGVGLRLPGKKAPHPVRIDFVGGTLGFRGRRSPHSRELVAKAVGVSPGHTLRVLDATAGLGRDAFILATLGCRVQMLERSPVVAALLADALARASHCEEPVMQAVLSRMALIQADALNFMAALPSHDYPDVVYLDPMFPERSKSASVKKDMRILQQLLGGDPDTDALFEQALQVALRKVVVKRPRIAPSLAGMQPHRVVAGKANRFDIYHVRALG